MRIDDDQDAVWLRVKVAGNGASCVSATDPVFIDPYLRVLSMRS